MKKKFLSIMATLMLLIAMPLAFAGCGKGTDNGTATALTMEQAQQAIVGTDLLADWNGFEGDSTQAYALYNSETEENEGAVERKTSIKAKGKTVSDFVIVMEGHMGEELAATTYVVDGKYYSYLFGSYSTGDMEEIEEVNSFYNGNLVVPFLFTQSNFETLFESGTKTTYKKGNYKIEVEISIENFYSEILKVNPESHPESNQIPEVDGKIVYTFNFNSDNTLQSFSFSTDVCFPETDVKLINGMLSKFDEEIEQPEWFNAEDYEGLDID